MKTFFLENAKLKIIISMLNKACSVFNRCETKIQLHGIFAMPCRG